jgi:hypothetical protein
MVLTIGPTNEVGAAVVDKEGRVLAKSIFRGQNLISNICASPESEFNNMVALHQPDYVVVEANSTKSRILLGEIRDHFGHYSGKVPYTCYGESGIPGLVARHKRMLNSS